MRWFKLCEGKQDLETHFPHHNWIVIMSFQVIISATWSVMTPTIYQFITTPPTLPEELKNDEDTGRFWPGLGGSDTDYALALTFAPVFEFAAVPLALLMTHRSPFNVTFLIGLLFMAVGGTMYALAKNVETVWFGRGVIGAAGGLCIPALHTYIGEMGTLMDDIRRKQGKKPRKFTLYIAFSFILNGGFMVSFGFTSLMAQFPDVNPYRWPGWFVTAQALALALAIIFFFTEPRSLSCSKFLNTKCLLSPARLKLSSQLRSNKLKVHFVHLFLAACGYLIGHYYALFITLITPVLSDQFGFNVEYTSHFLIGLSAAFFLSSFIQLGAKLAKIDNRTLLGLCLLLVLVGSVLMGDWQSIGHDPCFSSSLNTTEVSQSFNSSESYEDEHSRNTSLVEECEAKSSSAHKCFWNPQSRVTGEFCNTCIPRCLSQQKTLDVYQFSIGVLLLSIATPLGFVFISAISSDVTSKESQGTIMTLVLGAGIIGRGVTPYWLVESYELTGRHTYFAMAISAGCALVLILSLAVLYKNLAPIRSKEITISATFAQAVSEQKSQDCNPDNVVTISYHEVE